jgi:hypothetical protein
MLVSFLGCGKNNSTDAVSSQSQPSNGPAPTAGTGEENTSITRRSDGVLSMARADGTPIDGVKLSKYDKLIYSPCIAVGPDGVIHVAYVEQLPESPYQQFVYHRQSGDGGKTWSDPKNLSEDMQNGIGTCKLLIDGQNRTYVIWRSAIAQYAGVGQQEAAASVNNLVYRCLENGNWSKILPVHKPASRNQDDGSMSFVATVDPAGKPHVIFNTSPNRFHPDQALSDGQTLYGIGWGLIFQSTLDGSNPIEPTEWYMAPIQIDPANPRFSRHCDGFNALDGYVDAAGQPHLIAQLVNLSDQNTNMQVIENGKQTPSITLPPAAHGDFASHPPRLLVDGKGVRHIIAQYDGGENHAIRDYLLGSDAEPTIVMAAKTAPESVDDFTAFQGPAGKMAALIQTEKGFSDVGDSWICTNNGSGWSEPINLTNNAGRKTWASKQTGVLGNVATASQYRPGQGAVAWDKDGHLVIALINIRTGSFGLAVGGVTYASGDTATPSLFFYRL